MTVNVGADVLALDVNGLIPTTLVKQSSQGRTSTTSYADDAELAGVALSVGTWEVSVEGGLQGGTGGIAIKTQWGFSGTWSAPLRFCEGPTAANTVAGSSDFLKQNSAYATNADCVYGLSTSGAYTGFREWSRQVVVTVAGVMAFRWAPNVSNANACFVTQGTTLYARKLA